MLWRRFVYKKYGQTDGRTDGQFLYTPGPSKTLFALGNKQLEIWKSVWEAITSNKAKNGFENNIQR